jgi:hypothetical protein
MFVVAVDVSNVSPTEIAALVANLDPEVRDAIGPNAGASEAACSSPPTKPSRSGARLRRRDDCLGRLDRMLRHSHVLVIQGDSFRLRQKKRAGLLGSNKTNH